MEPHNGQKKALIVDDEKTWRDTVSSAVSRHGYEALSASGAAQALELYKQNHPDLVFADYQIGRDNGIVFARKLRDYENEAGVRARIVLMSSDPVNFEG